MAQQETLLARADRAFVDEEFQEAVGLYTQALDSADVAAGGARAAIYASRAHAQLKLDNYVEAVEDAAQAIQLDPQLVKAYLRKGIACFKLEEYESAKESFEAGARLAPSDPQFATWIRKCQAELEEDGDEDDGGVHAAASANGAAPSSPPVISNSSPAATPPPPTPAPDATTNPSTSAPLAPAAPAPQHAKYRHQHYQMQGKVTVDIFAKNLRKDQVSVQFQERRLAVVIRSQPADADSLPNGEQEPPYILDVELYGKVVPSQCRYEVLKTKVEVVMTKADATQWASLERSAQVAAPNYSAVDAPPVAGLYPTSTKKPKDWSRVEAEVKAMEEKGELADDPLSEFFKKIYSQGDEDTRRAMMKSFVESNGTVLSTNWGEVGKSKVECTPPDGMQVQKWEA